MCKSTLQASSSMGPLPMSFLGVPLEWWQRVSRLFNSHQHLTLNDQRTLELHMAYCVQTTQLQHVAKHVIAEWLDH